MTDPSNSPSTGPSSEPSPGPVPAEGPGHAAALYARISSDHALTQELFRQALQDPSGALDRIVALGEAFQLPVTREQVRAHVAALDDGASKQWLLKARGGL